MAKRIMNKIVTSRYCVSLITSAKKRTCPLHEEVSSFINLNPHAPMAVLMTDFHYHFATLAKLQDVAHGMTGCVLSLAQLVGQACKDYHHHEAGH